MNIELKDICKAYGDNVVLHHFNCHINEKSINCIMGASGEGKTTLLHIMMGLECPDRGTIIGLDGLRKSAVFQENRLCENLSALSNIKMVCNADVTENEIKLAFERVALTEKNMRQPVHQMSGGEKRRVSLIRALLAPFDILFLDEPFKGLDLDTKDKLIPYVKEMIQGKTVFLVTHDMQECNQFSKSCITLKH